MWGERRYRDDTAIIAPGSAHPRPDGHDVWSGGAMARSSAVVIGVDVGTTATKVIAYDTEGGELAAASEDYPLQQPEPGAAVQDPAAVLGAVRAAVRSVTGTLGDRAVAGVSFSAAMHSLLGLDGDSR